MYLLTVSQGSEVFAQCVVNRDSLNASLETFRQSDPDHLYVIEYRPLDTWKDALDIIARDYAR
jgi:hypothetical protein